MFAWIPIIGPIIEGIVSIFVKSKDVELGKYKEDTVLRTEALRASTQITTEFKDNISVRFSRDLVMVPGSIWCGLYLWDKIMDHRYPWLVWDVAPLDGPLAILPMALLTFFFGLSALGIWKR